MLALSGDSYSYPLHNRTTVHTLIRLLAPLFRILKISEYPSMFFPIFYKRETTVTSSSSPLFPWAKKPFQNGTYSYGKEFAPVGICSYRSKFFPSRVDPTEKGSRCKWQSCSPCMCIQSLSGERNSFEQL